MKGLDLGKQLGPLPLGGWIAVVVGGAGIGLYLRRRNGDTPLTTAEAVAKAPLQTGVGAGPIEADLPDTTGAQDYLDEAMAEWFAAQTRAIVTALENNGTSTSTQPSSETSTGGAVTMTAATPAPAPSIPPRLDPAGPVAQPSPVIPSVPAPPAVTVGTHAPGSGGAKPGTVTFGTAAGWVAPVVAPNAAQGATFVPTSFAQPTPGTRPADAVPVPRPTYTRPVAAPPLPSRNATTDRSITSIPESRWTDRQRQYADMHGLSGSR